MRPDEKRRAELEAARVAIEAFFEAAVGDCPEHPASEWGDFTEVAAIVLEEIRGATA